MLYLYRQYGVLIECYTCTDSMVFQLNAIPVATVWCFIAFHFNNKNGYKLFRKLGQIAIGLHMIAYTFDKKDGDALHCRWNLNVIFCHR